MSLIQYLTQIHLADGAVRELPRECRRLGIARPLIVTDSGVRRAGVLDQVVAALDGLAHTLFDETPPNPTEAAVRLAERRFRDGDCDGLIAVGGGSSIDLAKAVTLAVTHAGPLAQFALVEQGAARITSAVRPVIAVPTTAGTGSEVGRASVIIVDDGRKLGLVSPHLIPASAICDPELTLSLPAGLTAATGMDAIAHCIETFLSPNFNPPADGIALDGLRRGWSHIGIAVAKPDDRNARLNMMCASLQGALAFQKGLGCVHSLSHALGGADPRLHHGTLNAILLPAVLDFNRSASTVEREHKFRRLAEAMGLGASEDVAEAVSRRVGELGVPGRLSQLGVESSAFDAIITAALKDHCHATNPRVADREDYRRILAAAF